MPRATKDITEHFRKADPRIAKVMERMDLKPLRSVRKPERYFASLCREIISQQLAGKAAAAIHGRFIAHVGEATPASVAACTEDSLRALGLSWAKARYVKDLAEKAHGKEISFDKLFRMDDESVIAELTTVKGIGRWTAEMFLIFTLGREDVFSFGDLGLRKGIERVYGSRAAKSDASIRRITERWSPYRSYGSLALWRSIDEPAG